MGSAFFREYEHFITPTQKSVNPRRLFLRDLQDAITQLVQTAGHAIVLMMDANATLSSDPHLSEFMESCMLSDLHEWDPALSTFIGAPNQRIDFILGCDQIKSSLRHSGTLAYTEGPQSDHRGLFVDLDINFLHGSAEKIAKSISQGLHTGNPELVLDVYNTTVATQQVLPGTSDD